MGPRRQTLLRDAAMHRLAYRNNFRSPHQLEMERRRAAGVPMPPVHRDLQTDAARRMEKPEDVARRLLPGIEFEIYQDGRTLRARPKTAAGRRRMREIEILRWRGAWRKEKRLRRQLAWALARRATLLRHPAIQARARALLEKTDLLVLGGQAQTDAQAALRAGDMTIARYRQVKPLAARAAELEGVTHGGA